MDLKPLAVGILFLLATILHAQTTTLTFSDDFSAGQLDRTKWTYGGGAIINNESQAYVPDAITFSAAGLTIRTDKRPFSGGGLTQPYTSGEITTRGRFRQTYGYFEARMKLPKGRGLWPAFWLLPDNNSWPPEIDVLENLGHDPFTAHTTLHYKNPGHAYEAEQNVTGADFSAGFHTYAISWRPGSLTYYIDDVQVFQITGTQVPSTPMYMILNTAVGNTGNWPGPVDAYTLFPNTTVVSHVRVWQYDDVPAVPADKAAFGAATLVNSTTGQGVDAVNLLTPASSGDSLTLTTSLVLSPSKALPPETVHVVIMDVYSQAVIANHAVLTTGALAAGSTTPLTLNFTVPAGLAPGIYNIKLAANAYETSTFPGYAQAGFDPAAQFVVGSPLPALPGPPPALPPPPAGTMNLSSLVFTTVPGRTAAADALTFTDAGKTAVLHGNAWMTAPLPAPYTVTANTVLEFDFATEAVPQDLISSLYGIGLFPAGASYAPTELNTYAFVLAGSQGYGIPAFTSAYKSRYSLQLGGRFRFVIPIGQYSGTHGVMNNLLLLLHESTARGNTATLGHVRLYEGSGSVPFSAVWSEYPDPSILLDAMVVSPESVTLANGATQQFTVLGMDANGSPSTPAPAWSVASGPGSIDSVTGLYTAPASGGGAFTVMASYAGITATADGNIPVAGLVLFDDAPLAGGTLTGGATLVNSPVHSGTTAYGATASGYAQFGLSFANLLTVPAGATSVEMYVYLPGPSAQISGILVQLGAPGYQTQRFSMTDHVADWTVDGSSPSTTFTTGSWHRVRLDLAAVFGANWIPGTTKLGKIMIQVPSTSTTVYADDVQLK
jgi:beta-glucanase (GH16 family)